MALAFSPLSARSRSWFAFFPAVLLGLAGCEDDSAQPNTADPVYLAAEPISGPASESAVEPPPPPDYTDGSGTNEHYPDLSPTSLAADLEGTEAGARNVLLSFARAIELREYDQAWEMLDENAQQRWSLGAFNALFEGLEEITVAVPGGEMEGAAGSSYYTSQAEITASGADGRPIRIEGPIVLRRVNDVPGANEEQLRWHISRIDLTQTH